MTEPTPLRGTQAETAGDSEICVLGGFSVNVKGIRLDLAPTAQRLLALLALDSTPRPRELVAGTLWPDSSQRGAAASLRTALWRIRRLDGRLIAGDQHLIALSPQIAIDLQQMVAVVRRLAEGQYTDTRAVGALLRAELLPGWYDDWVSIERERIRQLRLHGLEELARRQASEGRFTNALETALFAVRCDDLRESAHRVVIEIHASEGNLSEALRHYAMFAARLKAELNVDPSGKMISLIERLMSSSRSRSSSSPAFSEPVRSP